MLYCYNIKLIRFDWAIKRLLMKQSQLWGLIRILELLFDTIRIEKI